MTDPRPGEDVFTEDDLAPSEEEQRSRRRNLYDRAAAIVAVSALGLWMGGLIALGTCAAPFVFERTPYPYSGQAMGAAFARFDGIAISCSLLVLGAEVVRTVLALRRQDTRPLWSRLRRYGAIVAAAAAVYSGLRLTPEILRLHEAGARRHVGPEGEALQALHAQAELFAKAIVPLALGLIILHIATLRGPSHDDDEALAPLPPGRR
jgi:putative copper export protein